MQPPPSSIPGDPKRQARKISDDSSGGKPNARSALSARPAKAGKEGAVRGLSDRVKSFNPVVRVLPSRTTSSLSSPGFETVI